MTRPYRSVLYIPAANQRAMDKARTLAADAIIFDLEDAVAPAEKPGARELLRAALAQDYGGRARIVRINGFDTEWGATTPPLPPVWVIVRTPCWSPRSAALRIWTRLPRSPAISRCGR